MSTFEEAVFKILTQAFDASVEELDEIQQNILVAHNKELAKLAKPAPAKSAKTAEQTDKAEEVVEKKKKSSDFAKITGLVADLQKQYDQPDIQMLLTAVRETVVTVTKNFSQTARTTATLYVSNLSQEFPEGKKISMGDLVIQLKEATTKAGIASKSRHVTTSGLVYGLLSADDREIMSKFYTELKALKPQ